MAEDHLHGLVLVVVVALAGHAVHALLAVEQVAGLVPDIAQGIDVETVLVVVFLHHDGAVARCGVSYLGVADTSLLEEGAQLLLVLVAHLYHDTRVLGKEGLDHVAVSHVVQVDMQTTCHVGKGHFEQGGYQTAGRDVVAGHDPSLPDEFLHRIEAVGEVLGILDRGHIIAHLAQCLGESRAAEALGIETEVDMIE